MKAGIVGSGAVGAATATALTLRARGRELVLVNRDRARAKPVLCASCRRVIPRHAEKTVIGDEPYHGRCWDRVTDLVQDMTAGARLALRPRTGSIKTCAADTDHD